MRRTTIAALVFLSALACKTAPEPAPQPTTPPPPTPAAPQTANLPMPPGLDETAMDPKADPCTDFYRYACGNWIDHTEIPADRAQWSRGFMTIAERNEGILRDILQKTAAGQAPEGTPYAQKLGDFWSTCMDEPKLEQSDKALHAELKKLDAVKDAKSLTKVVAELQAQGINPLFRFASTQDFKDATQVIGEIDQGGLGLPDRDYYVKDDPKTKEVRDAYAEHVEKMFELLGQKPDQAKESAATIMEIETALAKASMTRVERRDPEKVYHRIERAGLEAKAPDFGWKTYFKLVGAPDTPQLNVTHPPFFEELDTLVKTVPAKKWRTYLTWHTVMGLIPALPKRFQDERFRFTSKALSGAKEDLPRWKKCVGFTDEAIGFALAEPFVTETFGPDGKTTTSMMVKEIEQAFERDLDTLAWMDAPTKAKALEKVRKIINKIGYPEKWRNYDTMKIDKSSFLENILHANQFEVARDLKKIGKPLDRTEWLMTPPTVNAYYNPSMNEIVFPAGILQPPFFNKEATSAVNFGSMGMVVGHETTHGFDDEGRHFDANGNLTDWWTDPSAKAFTERAECVKKQFDGYTAIDDMHVNGALTLGENVADLGGLKLAQAAMDSWYQKNPNLDGPPGKYRFDHPQQFYLGFAQSWCSKLRPEIARLRANTDPHSPPFLRVNGPLGNLEGFREAFHCSKDAPMVRKDACAIW